MEDAAPSNEHLGRELAGLIVLVTLAASGVLFLFTAGSCLSSAGWQAVFCGNAKARGLSLIAIPALVGVAGSAVGLLVSHLLGRSSWLLWTFIAVASASSVVALVLLYVLGDPPPGFGPGWGD